VEQIWAAKHRENYYANVDANARMINYNIMTAVIQKEVFSLPAHGMWHWRNSVALRSFREQYPLFRSRIPPNQTPFYDTSIVSYDQYDSYSNWCTISQLQLPEEMAPQYPLLSTNPLYPPATEWPEPLELPRILALDPLVLAEKIERQESLDGRNLEPIPRAFITWLRQQRDSQWDGVAAPPRILSSDNHHQYH